MIQLEEKLLTNHRRLPVPDPVQPFRWTCRCSHQCCCCWHQTFNEALLSKLDNTCAGGSRVVWVGPPNPERHPCSKTRSNLKENVNLCKSIELGVKLECWHSVLGSVGVVRHQRVLPVQNWNSGTIFSWYWRIGKFDVWYDIDLMTLHILKMLPPYMWWQRWYRPCECDGDGRL